MNPNIIPLDIPVPPAPILEQAVGYTNTRGAHYLTLWWEPAGDEAMVSDGLVTFTGNWSGYLAFVHHKFIYHHLAIYNLCRHMSLKIAIHDDIVRLHADKGCLYLFPGLIIDEVGKNCFSMRRFCH